MTAIMAAIFFSTWASSFRSLAPERDGYYAKDHPEHRDASGWAGRGAEELGLNGPVDPAVFRAVLEGKVPDGSGTELGRRGKDGEILHCPGRDLTFSAPKSVSLAALVGGDRRIVEAHDRAVAATLAWVEKNAAETRMKDPETGKMARVGNQKIVAATFRHDTSRRREPGADIAPPSPAAEAVAWAMAYLSEREAVFSRNDLLAAALAYALGAAAIGKVEHEVAALEKAGTLHAVDLPGAEASLTTDRTVGEEREAVALWRGGHRDASSPACEHRTRAFPARPPQFHRTGPCQLLRSCRTRNLGTLAGASGRVCRLAVVVASTRYSRALPDRDACRQHGCSSRHSGSAVTVRKFADRVPTGVVVGVGSARRGIVPRGLCWRTASPGRPLVGVNPLTVCLRWPDSTNSRAGLDHATRY